MGVMIYKAAEWPLLRRGYNASLVMLSMLPSSLNEILNRNGKIAFARNIKPYKPCIELTFEVNSSFFSIWFETQNIVRLWRQDRSEVGLPDHWSAMYDFSHFWLRLCAPNKAGNNQSLALLPIESDCKLEHRWLSVLSTHRNNCSEDVFTLW